MVVYFIKLDKKGNDSLMGYAGFEVRRDAKVEFMTYVAMCMCMFVPLLFVLKLEILLCHAHSSLNAYKITTQHTLA